MTSEENPAAPKRLINWMDRTMRLVTADGVANRIELWVERQGDMPRKLAHWRTSGDRSYTPSELADEVYQCASDESDAALEGGNLRFVCYAFDNTERAEHCASHAFTLAARPAHPALSRAQDSRMDGGQALGALVRGTIEQQRLLTEAMRPLLEQQNQQIANLSAQNQAAMEAQREAAMLMRQLVSQTKREDIEMQREIMEGRRMDQWHALLQGVLPGIVANVMPTSNVGQHIAKHGKDPVRQQVQTLVANLTPAEVGRIATGLSPQNRQMFMAIAQTASADAQKADDQRPEAFKEGHHDDEQVEDVADEVNVHIHAPELLNGQGAN